METPFLGGFGVERSKNAEDNQLINLYPRFIEGKDGKEVGVLYITPGLVSVANVDTGPVRGMISFQGYLYVVSGTGVYQIDDNFNNKKIGTVTTVSSGPVSMIRNERQLAIFDGINGYLYSAGTYSQISLPFSGPVSATYLDEFGFCNVNGTNQFFQSNVGDLSTWQALNYSSADTRPTPIIALNTINDELWIFKSDCIEVWVDEGLNGFAFARIPQVQPQQGTVAPFSVARAGGNLIWLSQNTEGYGQIFLNKGYIPERVSTHAVEYAINQLETISDAIGYSYQQEGHLFYVITFPSGDLTFVFDLTTSMFVGQLVWHQRASWLNGQFHRHWGNCQAFFNNETLIGDFQSGNIFRMDMNAPLDNGQQRRWLRTWRAFKKPVMKPVKFPPLQIDMQSGIKVPDGSDPLVCLRWSDDGGNSFGPELKQMAGPPGATATRVLFRRIGSTRRGGGLDRIFELSSADVFGVGLLGGQFLDDF